MRALLLLLICCGYTEAQTLAWQLELTNPWVGRTEIHDLDFDSQGNVYVVGSYVVGYQDPEDPSPKQDGAFIQKYTLNGELIWADTAKGGFHTSYNDLAIDNTGAVWVLGTNGSNVGMPVVIDGHPIYQTSFLVEYGSSGHVYSVRDFAGIGELVFEPGEKAFYHTLGNSGTALLKYDASWNLLWSQSFGTAAPIRMRVRNSVVTIASGSGFEPLQFAKLTTAGQLLWTKPIYNGAPLDIAVDDSLNIYASHWTQINKFDPDGNLLGSYATNSLGGGYALEFYNGFLLSNSGETSCSKNLNTICCSKPYNPLWTNQTAFSDCAVHPTRISIDHNNLYGIGSFGYGNGFLYKLSLPVSMGFPETASETPALYPNPTSGILHINKQGADEFEIVDVSGRIVLTGNLARPSSIDITSLSEGIYYLRLVGEGKSPALFKVVLAE